MNKNKNDMKWMFITDVVEPFNGEIDLNEGKKSTISFTHNKIAKIADCDEIHTAKTKVPKDLDKINSYYYSEKDLNIRSKFTRKCKPHLTKDEIKCNEGMYLDDTKYDAFIKSQRHQPVSKEAVCVDHPTTITCGVGKLLNSTLFADTRKNYKKKITEEYIKSSGICFDDPNYVRLKFINDQLKVQKGTVEINQNDIDNMLNHYYDVFRV